VFIKLDRIRISYRLFIINIHLIKLFYRRYLSPFCVFFFLDFVNLISIVFLRLLIYRIIIVLFPRMSVFLQTGLCY